MRAAPARRFDSSAGCRSARRRPTAERPPGGADCLPIPRDLFAATVRVLDEAGQEIGIYLIPKTQARGDRLNVDTSKLLGVEGAAIVYRRLFGAL